MRQARWLLTALLTLVVLTGCTDTRKTTRRRMADRIDQARRLFNHAISLMADPQYIDKATGQVSPVDRRLTSQQVDVPASQPIEKVRVIELLEEAQKILQTALTDLPDASAGDRSDANLLLGQIQFSRGQFYADKGERVRSQVVRQRRKVAALLGMVGDDLTLVGLGKALSGLPKDKIQAMRDAAAKDLARAKDDIKALDEKIAQFRQQNNELSKENEALLLEAAKFRQQSETGSQTAGLPLLKQSQEAQGKANENASKVAANQQAVEALQVDRAFLEQKRKLAETKMAMFDANLVAMDKQGEVARTGLKDSQDRANKGWQDATVAAAQIIDLEKEMAGYEQTALEALSLSAGLVDQAEGGLGEVLNAAPAAARPPAPAAAIAVADERHLAFLAALKGAARLAMADLQSQQERTVKADAALAENLTATARKLPVEAPASVAALANGYLPDANKVHDQALENYKAAEADLQAVLAQLPKGAPSGNTVWIYQGQLASAFVGHYYLTGDSGVLVKAKQFVEEALRGKANSPYLASVVELKKLTEAPAGAGIPKAASAPSD